MKTRHILPRLGSFFPATALCCTLGFRLWGASPSLTTDHHSYLPGEAIVLTFQGGPANAKDWIGIVSSDGNPPASQNLISWLYVDDTQDGKSGLSEGSVHFTAGLDLAGDFRGFFLLNDGYTSLAEADFRVADATLPFIRPEKATYLPNEAIVVNFSTGPGSATDWIGFYHPGVTPGSVTSIDWRYVGGSQSASDPLTDGSVSFPGGLPAGDYVVFFLANDGYGVLASEPFTVALPPVTVPRITAVSPVDGSASAAPDLALSVTVKEGSSRVLGSSLVVKLDGVPVTPSFSRQGDTVQIQYAAPQLFSPLSSHRYEASFSDDAVAATLYSVNASFTVGDWHNIVLPAPLYFEDFEGVAEGGLPPGWVSQSYSTVGNPDFDLANLDSASYANWVVVNSARFNESLLTYSKTPSTDYQRVLTPNPLNVVNGKSLKGPLLQGRALFGDSGYRNGQSQVLFIQTADFDLTGKKDVHVGFYSAWEQNQDSIAALEYSIDEGQSWMPVVYLLDSRDIVTLVDETTGVSQIDVAGTFNTPRSDIARYTDEGGSLLGGSYGAFILAPISDDLASHIQGRQDDDSVGSKRVELFRLPQADNQPKVRLRFATSGTDSWYWGIDNLGLYSLPPAPVLRITRLPEQVQLSWDADYSDFQLQASASLSPGDWKPVAGVVGTQAVLSPSEAKAYFRLSRP